MGVEQGDVVMIKNVNLVKGSYIKMQPHTTDFVHLSDPKSVLESALIRGFTCSSAGDTIMIMHEGKKFYIDVLETKPVSAIRVNDTDCEDDFASLLLWTIKSLRKLNQLTRPFIGVAKRLDGSPVLTSVSASEECKQTSVVGRKAGKVVFGFSNAAFTGKSYRLGTE
ncbi:hypothetical protein FEM48_Zijuj04G0167500 [Ziziphus jujuba var. spinosa]|uniref:Ubiquitin fusion degradation protein UFD1 N-terminal subdomain 2 domain-containing protein n=1 Tax=Ziziphus jujuba var. spinosa TaxID=714518 RepID=A0A978VL05_ZIZJJ|nr:hypothetical protein FEM48_Zijuj04G0167500 [Ziziphus jujuba var. spinosa]